MLSNLPQYSPLGQIPQFPGSHGAGSPQMSPGLFGQPGAYGGNGSFGNESGQTGLNQPYPFGGQLTNPFLQNPFTQNQFPQGPFATNPYLQNPLLQSPLAHNPLPSSFAGQAGAPNPAQHIIPVLAQLAQQIAAQSAVTQQIGIALQQLAQHLAAQSGTQHFGQNPFASATQGGYGGFNPQAQAWGANRPQTIQ
jgi:hypothetical protein